MTSSPLQLSALEERWVRHEKSVAPADFLVLAGFYFQKDKGYLLAHKDDFLVTPSKAAGFTKLLRQRAAGTPVAYLTGHKEFYGLDFLVTPATLIPRPETECLVEDVLRTFADEKQKPITLLDIGTGSGCVAIALAKHLPDSVDCYASDVSWDALSIAKKNARRHSADIDFRCGSLLAPFRNVFKKTAHLYITANLPYVSEALYELVSKEVRQEPKLALTSEKNGLAHYFTLLEELKGMLPSERKATLWLEISPEQKDALSRYIENLFPHGVLNVLPDLSGRDRIVKLAL